MSDYSYNAKRKVYICKICQKDKTLLKSRSNKVEIINLIHMLEHLKTAHNLVSKVKIEPKGKKGYKTTVTTRKAH
jgi:hypothetical protein